jgi:hypothetical protein
MTQTDNSNSKFPKILIVSIGCNFINFLIFLLLGSSLFLGSQLLVFESIFGGFLDNNPNFEFLVFGLFGISPLMGIFGVISIITSSISKIKTENLKYRRLISINLYLGIGAILYLIFMFLYVSFSFSRHEYL